MEDAGAEWAASGAENRAVPSTHGIHLKEVRGTQAFTCMRV